MKPFEALSIRFHSEDIEIIDQTQLPDSEVWLPMDSVETMYEAIHSLRVRGAPLIGVSVALFLARFVEKGSSLSQFHQAADYLRKARPTAVNLMYAIDRLKALAEREQNLEAVIVDAQKQFEEDQQLCENIGRNGSQIIEEGDGVLHHCNTGGLATAGIGTALGVIQTAFLEGKKFHVYVDETRPLLQGGRLTTWELDKMGVPYTLICDNMAAALMRDKKIQKAIVGSDRIAMNGDFANKTGTYSVAVQCHYHRVPFYTAAPVTTLDFDCETGAQIPIEERDAKEVLGAKGAFGQVQWAPKQSKTYNPAFDVTPSELVSGWILDTGFYDAQEVRAGALKKLKDL